MNIKYISLLVVSLLACGNIFSQEQPGLRDKANALYNEYQYAKAAVIFQKLADRKKPHFKDLEKLAASYQKMNNYAAAEDWYARLIESPESSAYHLLQYAEVLKAQAKYAEAKKALTAYQQKAGDTKKTKADIAGCDSAIAWLSQPTRHKIKNEAVNTSLSEFSVFPADKKVFYTGEPEVKPGKTYGWTGHSFLRIYTADRTADNSLSGSIVSEETFNKVSYHAGPLSGNKAGNSFYVTRTYPGKKGEVTKEEQKKYNTKKLELYIYSKDESSGKWNEAPFPYNKVQEYSVGHAALSPDEKVLYFVSDMPGGQGGTDIWFCELQSDGSWNAPQNAGALINTSENEVFPAAASDGTLYFSSSGHPGMGGLDIFRSTGHKNVWKAPQNLRYPVNSAGDDFSFIANKNNEVTTGYLSSNRAGGKGGDDIYSFADEPGKVILALKGTVSNKETGIMLADAAVSLFSNGRELKGVQKSKQDGTFFFELSKNAKYKVVARKEEFMPDSAVLSTEGLTKSDTLEVALHLDGLFKKGKTIWLENIFYDLDKHNIREDAAAVLNELERTLRENPTLKIELSSHTDSRGKDSYNLALSQRRAQAAVDYLVSRGIAQKRLAAKGYGETRLKNQCSNGSVCSDAEHQENRRTEFTVLSY